MNVHPVTNNDDIHLNWPTDTLSANSAQHVMIITTLPFQIRSEREGVPKAVSTHREWIFIYLNATQLSPTRFANYPDTFMGFDNAVVSLLSHPIHSSQQQRIKYFVSLHPQGLLSFHQRSAHHHRLHIHKVWSFNSCNSFSSSHLYHTINGKLQIVNSFVNGKSLSYFVTQNCHNLTHNFNVYDVGGKVFSINYSMLAGSGGWWPACFAPQSTARHVSLPPPHMWV